MSTLVLRDPRGMEHTVPRGFPERPERLAEAIPVLDNSGWPVAEWSSERDTEGLAERARKAAHRVHDASYIERFEAAVAASHRSIDTNDNPLSSGTAGAAWGAVETAIRAWDWVSADEPAGGQNAARHAFCLTRPPGHHCERDRAMGFCYLNQVAVVAEEAVRAGTERVAILDFDVHHGNGTQHLFEERSDVFYCSLHQFPFYPGTGGAEEKGQGAGVGATLNLPLAAGTGPEQYMKVFSQQALARLHEFAPQELFVSAGFDAWRDDPLGGLSLEQSTFEAIGRELREFAGEHCGGRMVSILEGGYDLSALGALIDSYLRGAGS